MDGETQGAVTANLETPIGTAEAGDLISTLLAPESKEEGAGDPPAKDNAQEEGAVAEVEQAAEEMFTVKIDGKDVEIPKSELINGYKAQKSSTEKYEAAAVLRKEAEAETAKARAERQQYAQGLSQAHAVLTAGLQEQSQINWEQLLSTDPQEYLKQKHLFDDRQAKLRRVVEEHGKVMALNQQEQAQQVGAFIQQQQEELLAKLPDWKDEAKADAGRKELTEYLKKENFPPDLLSIVDRSSHLVANLYKAAQYDKLMEKAKAAAKKVSQLPTKVAAPGSGDSVPLDRRNSGYQKLVKTGNPRDAASVMEKFL